MEFTKEELANEEWRDVVGYEGLYQVSNLGRVKSLPRQRKGRGVGFRTTPLKVLKPIKIGDYLGICLCDCDKRRKIYIHRLVAETFIPNLDGKSEINHIDGDKYNNNVTNLEWCTHSENGLHAFRLGLHKPAIPKNKKMVCIAYPDGSTQICDSIEDASKILGVCASSVSRGISRPNKIKGCKLEIYESKCSNAL